MATFCVAVVLAGLMIVLYRMIEKHMPCDGRENPILCVGCPKKCEESKAAKI